MMHIPKVTFESYLKIIKMKMKGIGLECRKCVESWLRVSEKFASVIVFGLTVSVSCGIQCVCSTANLKVVFLHAVLLFLTSVKQVGTAD